MIQTSRDETHLQAVEDDIRFAEHLIGRIAAIAKTSPAEGKTQRAREVRRMLEVVEGVLVPLHGIRSRLRHDA